MKFFLRLSIVMFYFLFLLFLSSNVFSVKPTLIIDETTTLIDLSGQYSLDSSGTLTISNPSNVSTIYEIRIPISLDSLVGVSRINSSGDFEVNQNSIRTYLLGPGESVWLKYHIFGLLSYNILPNLIIDDDETIRIKTNIPTSNFTNQSDPNYMSVLEYYSDSFDLSSNIILNLDKVEREGVLFNDDANRTYNSSPSGNTSRLVSSYLRNPTDFDYLVRNLNMYSTQVGNPMFGSDDIIATFSNFTLGPYDYDELNFFHQESNDYSVYWVSSDTVIDYEGTRKYTIIQKVKSGSSSGGGGSISFPKNPEFQALIVKKDVDKTIVNYGDEFEIVITIANINEFDLYNLTLMEEIPEGYEIVSSTEQLRIIDDNKIEFNIDSIDGYGSLEIKYKLKNNDEKKGVTFLKPAQVFYEEDVFYSEGVLLINEFLGDKKVFVQKEIEFEDDNFARVTLIVKNLGPTQLENILISDILDESAIVKEISKVFVERGVWKIRTLEPGEEWTVTYLIERNPNLETLPNVYGVDKTQVFGTLIQSEEVITIFREQPRTIEKVGLGLAVGLLIFYLLF